MTGLEALPFLGETGHVISLVGGGGKTTLLYALARWSDPEQKRMMEATGAQAVSFDLANERYKAGVDNHLVLLDAQRTYLASRQNLINTYLLRESNSLSLYKSLGGGWQ